MRVRPPHVAGAAGGVGASVVAAALLALDCGVFQPGMPVDVLVCRDTLDSLGTAQRALALLRTRPILAVVTGAARFPPGFSLRGPIGARVRMAEGNTSGVALIPFVPSWREVESPWQHAQSVLTQPPTRATRDFRAAIERLVSHLTTSDALAPFPTEAPPHSSGRMPRGILPLYARPGGAT